MFEENNFFDGNFHKIIDLVRANIYWKDLEGRYLGCNKNMLDQIGLISSKEIIGKTDFEVLSIPENEISQLVENDQFALKNGVYEGEEYGTFNGETLTFSTKKVAFLNSKGEIAGIMATSLDISNQKKLLELERKKFEEQVKLTQIIDSVKVSIYWKDLMSEKYLGCNQYMLDMFGIRTREGIVGKNEYDILSYEEAQKITQNDQSVFVNGHFEGEESFRLPTNELRTYHTIKSRLTDSQGNVIGLVGNSIDITEQKEAKRLKKEAQKLALQEKEKLITLAHTVAHDISSPLSALNMMMHACDELKESKRNVIKRAIESILDIANNLLSTYRSEEQRTTSEIEQRQPVLISDLIVQLLSEKKVQFSNHAVQFETEIANDAQFAFAQMQASQFRRSMSNLINNAVDALDDKSNGLITIKLTADAKSIVVAIQDNGKGMPSELIQKMLNRQSFTEGKEQGHGLGLQQVWNTLDNNQGKMDVHSTPGEGTIIQLTFPRIEAASWIAQTIYLAPTSIVVILDDEESIHGAWDTRFAQYAQLYPTLKVHHFKQGQEALDFFNSSHPKDKDRILFLSDYELLRQDKNGLQIVEESGIQNTTLVTSYYSNPQIRDKAIGLGVKILPKQMASIIPIEIAEHRPVTQFFKGIRNRFSTNDS
jgi:PAS domain S-box-containing protein